MYITSMIKGCTQDLRHVGYIGLHEHRWMEQNGCHITVAIACILMNGTVLEHISMLDLLLAATKATKVS
jgi:hypothetical protein